MCTRTKVSYRCGHASKNTSDCRRSTCTETDRYHYLKDGDCRECRAAHKDMSRGREGKVQYYQHPKRSRTRERIHSSSEETLPARYDVSGGASPWAQQTKQEKSWESPHRKQADEAWLSEHEDRILDLSGRLDKVKISERSPRPKHSKERMIVPDDQDYDHYEDDDYVLFRNKPSRKSNHYESRRQIDIQKDQQHSGREDDRQYSRDSLPDSMPSYRSSPRLRQTPTPDAVNPYPETKHEYDYYNDNRTYDTPSKHQYRRHYHTPSRSRTEPHHSRRSRGYESDYEIKPLPPPLQMPAAPATATNYDTYDYYSPGAAPARASYSYSDYPFEMSRLPPPPQPQHYASYRRY